MSIPTGFFTDITKNYYGIDPASQAPEEVEVSDLLWKDFLSKVATETDPYFNIISSRDEEAVRQALIAIASEYMSPLTEEALTDIGYLAHELAVQRGEALASLTSKDSTAVKTLLTDLIAPHIEHTDNFILTILPSIAEDIAVANGEKQKLYLDYLKGKLDVVHTAEASIGLSMTEMSNRQVIYTLYDIILTLINNIVDNQILESTASYELAKKKEQYLELMRTLFVYKGAGEYGKLLNELPFIKIGFEGTNPDFVGGKKYIGSQDWLLTNVSFNTNPSLYNLGYGNLTLQEIFTSLFNSVAWQTNAPNSATFSLKSTPVAYENSTIKVGDDTKNSLIYRQTSIDLSIQKNPTTGAFTVTSKFTLSQRHADRSSTQWYNNWTATPTTMTQSKSITPPAANAGTYDLVMAAFASTYYSVYNYAKSNNLVGVNPANFETWASPYLKDKLGTKPADDLWKYQYLAKAIEPKIPWPYTIAEGRGTSGILLTDYSSSVSDQNLGKAIVNNALQARNQANKMLNTYLDTIRSKIDLVGDSMDTQTQITTTSATAKKNTINILQAVIRQLQNLLASIYR